MSDIIKYENTFKTRFKRFLKSKKALILLLVIFLAITIAGVVLFPRKDKAPVTYDSVIDIATSNMPDKLANGYKQYDALLSDYYSGKYQEVINGATKYLKSNPSDELVSSYYYLVINSYIELKDIKSAERTVEEFKKTEPYKNIDQEAKSILDKNIEQAKTDLSKVKNEN